MGFFARLVVAIENVIGRIFPALKRPRKWQRGNGTLPPASPNVPYPPAPPRPVYHPPRATEPDTFTLERVEKGYRASGPLNAGWHINVIIIGKTSAISNAPFLDGTNWPFLWMDNDPNTPPKLPVRWFIYHSDYRTQIGAPDGGVKETYEGRIKVDGTTSAKEPVVEIHSQAEENARRAKQREIRKRNDARRRRKPSAPKRKSTD